MNSSIAGKLQEHSGSIRWIALILVSVTIAANYYVYDALSSIKSVIQAQIGISSTEYGIIISFYSVPNTFLAMAIIGGIILDKWGIRKTGLLFVSFCVGGAFLTAYGASQIFMNGGPGYDFFNSFLTDYSPEMKLMILGRLLFGLGAETSIVVINKILVKWFKGKELALAFGVNLAIARLGTAMALIFSPILVDSASSVGNAVWVASVLMLIGFLFFIIYIFFDISKGKNKEVTLLADDEKFRLKDIVTVIGNKSFLYICFLCVIFYSAVFPFLAYCPDFLYNKFGVSLESSGTLTSIVIFGTILFTPLFGYLVDLKGKRASLMIMGSLILVVVHLMLSLTTLSPYVSMFALGVAFSLVPAAMWPAVTLIVKERLLGTAYGIMFSVQNFGLWLFPILAGWVLDKTNPLVDPDAVAKGVESYDYTYTMLMFAAVSALGVFFAFMLKHQNSKVGNHGLELGKDELIKFNKLS